VLIFRTHRGDARDFERVKWIKQNRKYRADPPAELRKSIDKDKAEAMILTTCNSFLRMIYLQSNFLDFFSKNSKLFPYNPKFSKISRYISCTIRIRTANVSEKIIRISGLIFQRMDFQGSWSIILIKEERMLHPLFFGSIRSSLMGSDGSNRPSPRDGSRERPSA
jgi:hypothetical protein